MIPLVRRPRSFYFSHLQRVPPSKDAAVEGCRQRVPRIFDLCSRIFDLCSSIFYLADLSRLLGLVSFNLSTFLSVFFSTFQ